MRFHLDSQGGPWLQELLANPMRVTTFCDEVVALPEHATGHAGTRQLPEEEWPIVHPAHFDLQSGQHLTNKAVGVPCCVGAVHSELLQLRDRLLPALRHPSGPAPLPLALDFFPCQPILLVAVTPMNPHSKMHHWTND